MMIFSSKSIKCGLKSLRKFDALAVVDILISFIIDLDTSDSNDSMSSSVG